MQLSHAEVGFRAHCFHAQINNLVGPPSVRCTDANSPLFAFTVSVGRKSSKASQYADSAEDVADLLVKMAAGSNDVCYERKKERERQLKQFS